MPPFIGALGAPHETARGGHMHRVVKKTTCKQTHTEALMHTCVCQADLMSTLFEIFLEIQSHRIYHVFVNNLTYFHLTKNIQSRSA